MVNQMLKGFRFWQVLVVVILGTCIMGNEALAAKRVVPALPKYAIFDMKTQPFGPNGQEVKVRASIWSHANTLTVNQQTIHTSINTPPFQYAKYAMVRTPKIGRPGYDFNLIFVQGGLMASSNSLILKKFNGDNFASSTTINIPIPSGFQSSGNSMCVKTDLTGNIYVLLGGHMAAFPVNLPESFCLFVINQNLASTAFTFTPQSPRLLHPLGTNMANVNMAIDEINQHAYVVFKNLASNFMTLSAHLVAIDMANSQILDDRTLNPNIVPSYDLSIAVTSSEVLVGYPAAHPLVASARSIELKRRDAQGVWSTLTTPATSWQEPLAIGPLISSFTPQISVVHGVFQNGPLVLESSNDFGLTFNPPVFVDSSYYPQSILNLSFPNDYYSLALWPNLPMVGLGYNGVGTDMVLFEFDRVQYRKNILYPLPSGTTFTFVDNFQIIPY